MVFPLGKISLIKIWLVICLTFLFIIYNEGISSPGNSNPTLQYNQSSSINITGNASTTIQSEINNRLDINADGLTWDVTEALLNPDLSGVMVYGRQLSAGMVYAKTYTSPTTVGAEYTTVATSASAIQHIKIKPAPTRDEYVTAHLKADGRLDVLRCISGCDATVDWSLIGTLVGATSTTNSVRRGFDVAYEQISGRTIVVFADDPTAGKAYYCIWDGTSWLPSATCGSTFTPGIENEINFGTGGVPVWIRLVEKPGSNEMLLGILDSANTYAVARWNGTSWVDIVNIGTGAAVIAQQAFDLAWETNTGSGLIVFDKTALDGTTQYRRYVPGTGWDAADRTGPDTGAGNNRWIELASDPNSNRISMIIGDSEGDASICIWKADDVTDGFTCTLDVDTTIETTTGKTVATVWSRGATRALFSYTDANALTQDVVCWTPAGFTTITADVGGSNTDDVDNIIYVGSPDTGDAFALRGDIVDDLVATRWDGAGCGSASFTRIPSTGTLTADLSVTIDNSAPIEFSFAYKIPIYQVSVEHNTTVSYSGTLNSINVLVNFTSTQDDDFTFYIYNFSGNNWFNCNSQSATANTYYNLWCNVSSSDYNSSSGIVRIRLNSTVDSDKSTLKEEYVQYYINYQVGYLEVKLIYPDPSVITNIVQNTTFVVNATVICKAGPCGYVNGTVRYNLTSPYPDTPVNITQGDKPFFIQEEPALVMKPCPTNPLDENEFCNITWVINATGEIYSGWKIGVLFNSSYQEVQQNHTENSTVYITSCTEEIGLAWASIDFDLLIPSTNYNPAPYNNQKFYNITNKGACTLNLWIKGTDLQNTNLGSTITVGNLSWSNYSSNYADFHRNMTSSYVLVGSSLPQNENLTTYYWLSVPAVYAGYYNGSVYICGNYSSIC